MICYRHKNSVENFNKQGKEFALYFEENKLYRIHKDNSVALVNSNAAETKEVFEKDVKNPNGQLYLANSEKIDWNILDFT